VREIERVREIEKRVSFEWPIESSRIKWKSERESENRVLFRIT